MWYLTTKIETLTTIYSGTEVSKQIDNLDWFNLPVHGATSPRRNFTFYVENQKYQLF